MSWSGSEKPVFTDHALVRFLERSGAVDCEKLKEDLTRHLIRHYKVLGDGNYPLVQGLKAIVRDGRVVTVLRSEW